MMLLNFPLKMANASIFSRWENGAGCGHIFLAMSAFPETQVSSTLVDTQFQFQFQDFIQTQIRKYWDDMENENEEEKKHSITF